MKFALIPRHVGAGSKIRNPEIRNPDIRNPDIRNLPHFENIRLIFCFFFTNYPLTCVRIPDIVF